MNGTTIANSTADWPRSDSTRRRMGAGSTLEAEARTRSSSRGPETGCLCASMSRSRLTCLRGERHQGLADCVEEVPDRGAEQPDRDGQTDHEERDHEAVLRRTLTLL